MPLVFTGVDKASRGRLAALLGRCLPNHHVALSDLAAGTVAVAVGQPVQGKKPAKREQALAKWLKLVIDAKRTTSIKVARSEDDRWISLFDNFAKSLIDLQDFEHLKARSDGLACAILAHVVVEQYGKQVGKQKYPKAHKLALKAEAEVLGAPRHATCYLGGYTGTVLCWKHPPKGEVRCVAFGEYRGNPEGPPKSIALPSKSCKTHLMTTVEHLRDAVRGDEIEAVAVFQAVKTLEQATGIAASVTENVVGRHYASEDDLAADLDAWAAWLDEHGDNVRFDRATWTFYADHSGDQLGDVVNQDSLEL